MKKYAYYLPDEGGTVTDTKSVDALDYSHAAALAAERWFNDGGGEPSDPSDWPIVFAIIGDEGEKRFSVEMEYTPIFYAYTNAHGAAMEGD